MREREQLTKRTKNLNAWAGAHIESFNTMLVAIVYMCRTRLWGFKYHRALRGVLPDAVSNPA